jgi:hypothetical protein
MAKLFPVTAGLFILAWQAAGQAQTNPILNPGFERWTGGKPENWAYSGITWIKKSTTEKFEGAASVGFELPPGTTLPELRQNVGIAGGGVYSFSCRVLDNTPGGQVGLVISWFKGSEYLNKYSASPRSQDRGDWQEISVGVKQAPPEADVARLSIKTYKADASSGGFLYADQAVFYGDVPLSVHLGSFEAVPVREGIEIRWATESESNTCGFNVLRSDSDGEAFTALNPTLIPSRGCGSSGSVYSLTDRNVMAGTIYRYALEELNADGDTLLLGTVQGTRKKTGPMPETPLLIGVYPNPLHPAARIRFRVDPSTAERRVRLVVLDAAGRRIRTLADRSFEAGENELHWDGRDDSGRTTPAGVYLIRMESFEEWIPAIKAVKVE